MKSADQLIYEQLEEHGKRYHEYTKLILSLSTLLIGLLITFRKDWVNGCDYLSIITPVTMTGLFISFVSGVIVQYLLMMRPYHHASEVERLQSLAQETHTESPLELRKKPNLLEQWIFRIQIVSFFLSMLSLVIYFIVNAPSG